ncbi:MAG: RIP metalloprotease RseP [Deltaproteobacteria bacterium]|nr:RIP metalloprotease RseP [Deltaproteobacteria bacterium]
MTTVISAVIVLGVLIFVHELGHFLVAKWAGVGVTTFSLGFGPRLFGFKRGETDYRLSAIPLGGFVRMVGEDPTEEVTPEEADRSFSLKPVGWRLAIVAAGPLSNLLFAVVAYFLVMALWGLPVLTSRVGQVVPDQPGAAAGLKAGDMVRTIDGQTMKNWADMVEAVQNSEGKVLHLEVERDGRTISFDVKPDRVEAKNIFGESTEVWRLGLMASSEVVTWKLSLGEAFVESFAKTYEASRLIFLTVVKLVQAKVSPKTLGGPIFIAQVAGEAARQGLDSLLEFAALISVNLAILNFLPMPPLDGGQIFFFLVEAVRRKPVSVRVREKFQQVGVVLLVALMVMVFYNDIARLITQNG